MRMDQTVVPRLAEHSLVLTTPAARAVLCGFTRSTWPLTLSPRWSPCAPASLQVLAEEVGAWSTPPVHASLYGSAARGDGTTVSDLDLLVVRPDLTDSRTK